MRKIYIFIIALIVILIILFGLSLIIIENFNFGKPKIAKVYLYNEIYFDYSKKEFPWEERRDARYYINLLDKLMKDNNTKGVLLVINSPGGEVVASEELAEKVAELSKKKPVVVYIETLACSGAYMVAAPANYIVSQRHSIVGSIGVRMDIIHYYNLMKKLGVNVTTIKAGKYKDIGSPFRPITKEEREYLEKIINETYNYFVEWVAKYRHIPLNKVYKIADGKIYTGEDAVKLGLVDQVGSEEDAMKKLKELANVTNVEIEEYGLEGGYSLFGLAYYLGRGIGDSLKEINLGEFYGYINS
ncbi:signal peptide peptidase SppA, 36K type [Methanocaldococcus villosus KIN24-T80]|uniref:Signal peptide peptidase SppA, 36K type n=1 Tax=Methanocaldococcus villosus KIN24-T80 TaxID=1069083 RepID=N6UU43_9EURY|nr:signal peptide peptidase SppA [Methanocaldococcus villosus]ENN95874.1 signal peptide peptidase SppA, 36K type [Methanocaldococcus villosus KIN24-T80]